MNILTHEENLALYDETIETALPKGKGTVDNLHQMYKPGPTTPTPITRCETMMLAMGEAEKDAIILLRALGQLQDVAVSRLVVTVRGRGAAIGLCLATIYWQSYYLLGLEHLHLGPLKARATDFSPDDRLRINRMLREIFDERGQSYGSSYQRSPFPFFAMVSLLRPRVERVNREFVEKISLTYENRESNLVDVCNYAVMGYMELERQLKIFTDFDKYIIKPFGDFIN